MQTVERAPGAVGTPRIESSFLVRFGRCGVVAISFVFGRFRVSISSRKPAVLIKVYATVFVTCIVTVNKSRTVGWAGRVTRMGQRKNVRTILVGKHEGKRPLEILRCEWEG
jgi:hypothetical protein